MNTLIWLTDVQMGEVIGGGNLKADPKLIYVPVSGPLGTPGEDHVPANIIFTPEMQH